MDVAAVFLDPILPVFAVLALGYALGRVGAFSLDDARAINRLVMMVLVPVVVFGLIARADVRAFSLTPALIYVAAELLVFAAGFWLARHVFRRPPGEAVLLAFGAIFSNTVFVTLPISLLLYGPDRVLPMTTVVSIDSVVTFSVVIIAVQLMSLGEARPMEVAGTLVRSPLLQAIAAGAIVNAADVGLPGGVGTFVNFTGSAAAPVALFSLGLVLSSQRLMPDRVVLAFSGVKLLAFPAVVAAGLMLLAPDTVQARQFVLGAAGPAGAMSFTLALLHGIRTEAIAGVILWTSIASVVPLALLA